MARLFNDASSEYLETDQAVLANPPITMACWFNSDDADAVQTLMFLGDKDAGNQYHHLLAHGGAAGDPVYVQSRSPQGTGSAITTSGYSVNTWHHACGVWPSGLQRNAFIDGGSKGSNSQVIGPGGLNRTTIGRCGDSSPGFYMSGRIAEAAIWNVALSDEEVALLAKRFSPLFVRPQNLMAYWPLVRDTDIDKVGRYNLTGYNSPGIAEHAPIIYPATPFALALAASKKITPLLLRAIEKY